MDALATDLPIGLGQWRLTSPAPRNRLLGVVQWGMETPEGRPIPGCGDHYLVTPDGRVWSRPRPGARGGYRKLGIGKDGYLIVVIRQLDHRLVTLAVAPLVAKLYLGPKPDGLEVRHLDGVNTNNAWTNLTYGTHSQNMRDRRTHGTDWNVNKTHCPAGHPYDEENTYWRKDRPGRHCKACGRKSRQ